VLFRSADAADVPTTSKRLYGDVRDTFNLSKPPTAPQNNSNAVVTDVAWSLSQSDDSEVIAAAGSNGVVVVWDANDFLTAANSAMLLGPAPEAVLSLHSRAVNRLAWHPSSSMAGCLLTASQDSTVKLWIRTVDVTPSKLPEAGLLAWFGGPPQETRFSNTKKHSYSWTCTATFAPKAEAVRDMQWSPFHDDVFAMVTDGGSLIIYNTHVSGRPWIRIAAHAGEATTVDWHSTKPYIIATGGGGDRTVKIWDLESKMDLDVIGGKITLSQNTLTTPSEHSWSVDSSNEDSSGRLIEGIPSSSSMGHTAQFKSMTSWSNGLSTQRTSKSSLANLNLIHVLYISASVTKVMWRPPTGTHVGVDIHASMLAVATAPIKGASAGGNGLLGLWSFHRPFMPLSVVEGHKAGAVTDFVWLDTPQNEIMKRRQEEHQALEMQKSPMHHDRSVHHLQSPDLSKFSKPNKLRHISEGNLNEESISYLSTEGTWQHVLSVGRDGQCILQSFVRGFRPISLVSPSCFAMANLSPFQRGYGSLQVFSVHQKVPLGPKDDFLLTGLRRDLATASAPGIFREIPLPITSPEDETSHIVSNQRIPGLTPTLVFNVIDQGDLDDDENPVVNQEAMTIAPEVVHLSRFANSYKLYPDQNLTTRVDLCTHNAGVAQRLQLHSLAHMWRTVACILKGANLDVLPPPGSPFKNALQFALAPTMKSLLQERADAGDVQTCVALCELLEVIDTASVESKETRIPGLELNLVREWYLSYIDLLQQMCLFSHATFLIRSCKDPFIGALNQQSTTIHESCPHCGKPIPGSECDPVDSTGGPAVVARRACQSCRRRIGMCFLCHEPVTGVFVWCPGCGHGGHLDHALEWFGGMSGNPVREVCPTGCGHKCNLTQQLNSFPRTESFFKCMEVGGSTGSVD